ncbi:sodium/hydrogen exchanger 9B2-like [Euwallacea similis]|uniref:sodium/hydrogen exchanger 9B2-like n=1 Tax=Euwallacea similis TaxID=1736056 RepID=UPI0034501856
MHPKSSKILKTPSEGDVCQCSVYLDHKQLFLADNGSKRIEAGESSRPKKFSVTESVLSKTSTFSRGSHGRRHPENNDIRSWWYLFCLKCRSKEIHPSWQPKIWPKICPYPFCPTYRQFSRILSLTIIGICAWCVLYSIVGETATPPNGILYQIIFLTICSHFGGWLMSLTTLPPLIGMLFTGVLLQNIGFVNINEDFSEINKVLRELALIIILIRAGLDLDPQALKRLKFTVVKLGLIPWLAEGLITAALSNLFLGLPWSYAALLGSIVAAVSPAVVVSCLFRLRTKGYGVAKGIPTLIIAISGIDDAISVAIFGIIKSVMFSQNSLTRLILQGPVSIFGGILFGAMWGVICKFAPERHDPFMVPLRILLLLVGGTVTVFGSRLVGYSGAGPLACVAAAFTCLVFWSRQGWEIEDNPAATAFEIFWMIFEPVLFGLTGAQVKFSELDASIVSIGTGILVTAFLLRMVVTVVVSIGCNYNVKEKVFIAFALMAKATVQAALAPVILGMIDNVDSKQYVYANKIMMVCILSIIVTAPTGAILITLTGPRLLTKTRLPIIVEGWRRSHRPSIRDITIIDGHEGMGDNAHVTDNLVEGVKTVNKSEENLKVKNSLMVPES